MKAKISLDDFGNALYDLESYSGYQDSLIETLDAILAVERERLAIERYRLQTEYPDVEFVWTQNPALGSPKQKQPD